MIHSYSKIKTDGRFNEDFKTYSTIGILQYLPAAVFWRILRGAVVHSEELPDTCGEIIRVDFWAKWHEIAGREYVEPDVFIRFEKFDCIVELKKTDLGGQHSDQWADQIEAYRNRFAHDGRRIVYIALGGNSSLCSTRRYIYPASWQRLLHQVHAELAERENNFADDSVMKAEMRVLCSVIDAFALYNEYDVEFLSSLQRFNTPISLPSVSEISSLWKI